MSPTLTALVSRLDRIPLVRRVIPRHPRTEGGGRRGGGRRAVGARPVLSALEDRSVPAAVTTVDLTTPHSSGQIGDAWFYQFALDSGAGSGALDSFLRLQQTGSEHGYNSDGNPQFDELKGNFTHAMKLSDISGTTAIDGTGYREFVLDANEGGTDIFLRRLQFFVSTDGTIGTTPDKVYDTVTGKLAKLDPVYDTGALNQVKLIAGGSGRTDMVVLVPDRLFGPGDPYVYLYCEFGNASNGYEEWSVSGSPFDIPVSSSIRGYVYDTADGSPLDGATVYLDLNNNMVFDTGEPSRTSGDSGGPGEYSFEGLAPDTYYVRQIARTGFHQVTADPGPITLLSSQVVVADPAEAAGDTRQIVQVPALAFGDARDAVAQATVLIEGRVFEDLNGNGADDADPGPAAAWSITLQVGSVTETILSGHSYTLDLSDPNNPVFTDENVPLPNGRYAVTVRNVGLGGGPVAYSIAEIPQAGWTQTSAIGGYAGSITGDDSIVDQSFGNFQNVSIGGTVWDDADGDGVRESGEAGLGGWTVLVNGADVGLVTDAGGGWAADYGPGPYTFQVQAPAGWFTTAGAGGYTVTVGADVPSGGSSTGNDFGAFQGVSIGGSVAQDPTGSGLPEVTPTGLSGWTVILDDNGNGAVDAGETAVVSGAGGTWTITGVGPGEHTLTLVLADHPGWTETLGPGPVTPTSGQPVTGLNFLVFQLPVDILVSKAAVVPPETPTENGLPVLPVGSTVTWRYTVTNAGPLPLSGVTVTDDHGTADPGDDFTATYVSGDTDQDGLLDTDETWIFTATRTVEVGPQTGTGAATGTDPNGQSGSGSSNPAGVFGAAQPALVVTKLTNGQSGTITVPAGSTVTWTYTVFYPVVTGALPLSGAGLSDDNGTPGSAADDFAATYVSGDANDDGLLDPGETWIFTATGIAVAGPYRNTATATGTDPAGQSPTPASSGTAGYVGAPVPAITVSKLTNGQPGTVTVPVGSPVIWTFTVSYPNVPGAQPLSGVTVTDDNGTPGDTSDDFNLTVPTSGDTNPNGQLDPGETWTFTVAGTAAAGSHVSPAFASGIDSLGQSTGLQSSAASGYFGAAAPSLTVTKQTSVPAGTPTLNGDPLIAAGSPVTWTYAVSYTAALGALPLSGVTVVDDNGTAGTGDDFAATYASGDTNNDGFLDPGETWTFTATRTAVAGAYSNTATATGTDPVGQTGTATSNAATYFGVTAGFGVTVVKTVVTAGGTPALPDGTPILSVGDPVTWQYVLTNQGNLPLTVTLTDSDGVTPVLDPNGDTNHDGFLDPSETWVYSAGGTVVAGSHTNVATASGTDAFGRTPTGTGSATYFGALPTGLTFSKTTNGSTASLDLPVGSTVTWTYTLLNTGNLPITVDTVTDDNGTPGNSNDDFNPTYIIGDDGNGQLDPGEAWTYTYSGIVGPGAYGNTAHMTGTTGRGTVTADSNTATYFGAVQPALVVTKVTTVPAGTPTLNGVPLIRVGDAVTWTYTVFYPVVTGALPLSGAGLIDDNGTPGVTSDDFTPDYVSGDDDHNGKLDPGETWTFSKTKTAVAGDYRNIATATGTDPAGQSPTPSSAGSAGYTGVPLPVVTVTKVTAGPAGSPTLNGDPLVTVGGAVTWTYTVSYPAALGAQPLSGVTVTDDNGTPDTGDDVLLTPSPNTPITGDTNGDGLLDPGETWTFTVPGTAAAGPHVSPAVATWIDPVTLSPGQQSSAPSGYIGAPQPAITVTKLTNGQSGTVTVPVGGAVTWTYTVSYPAALGGQPLSGVTVTDDNGTPNDPSDDVPVPATPTGGDTDQDGLLDPGEVWTFTVVGSAAAGRHVSPAIASGVDPLGQSTGPQSSAASGYFGSAPALTVTKLTNGSAGPVSLTEGDPVTWTYTAVNTGNVPLSGVVVTDDNGTPNDPRDDFQPTLTGGDDGNGLLDPGETWTYTAHGVARTGAYGNIAHVIATGPTGPVGPFDSNTATYRGSPVVIVPPVVQPPVVILVHLTAVGAGNGGGPRVLVFNPDGSLRFDFFAYDPGFRGGVTVATADVDGDGTDDIIVGSGPGGGPHVRVFRGTDLRELASFFAFDPAFRGGVFVSGGDLDGDGRAEVVVGAGVGGGPAVAAFRIRDGAASPLGGPLGSFYAYDPAFTGGVRVAVGDIDGDGRAEVVTGAGDGGSGHVRTFRPDGLPGLSFFAYEDSFRGGVYVAVEGVGGVGRLFTGAGEGGAPRVIQYRVDGGTPTEASSYFAYDPGFRGGVRVGHDIDPNGQAGPGVGGGPQQIIFAPGQSKQMKSVFAFEESFRGGIYVG